MIDHHVKKILSQKKCRVGIPGKFTKYREVSYLGEIMKQALDRKGGGCDPTQN